MFYESKPAPLPQRNATLRKSASPVKGASTKIVKEALKAQEERHKEAVSAKERIIRQQKEIMLKQQEQLARLAQSALNLEPDSPKKEVIELRDVQKLQELDVQDRYNVLEYLVKELIGLKAQRAGGYIDHSSSSVSHHHKPKHHTEQGKKEAKPKSSVKKDQAEVESISVDSEADKVVVSSSRGPAQKANEREDWEEELTSTQNLALTGSAAKIIKHSGIVEPTIKLNNFVAPGAAIHKSLTTGAKPAANKFSSIRKASD